MKDQSQGMRLVKYTRMDLVFSSIKMWSNIKDSFIIMIQIDYVALNYLISFIIWAKLNKDSNLIIMELFMT